jgi:hypothetical protein
MASRFSVRPPIAPTKLEDLTARPAARAAACRAAQGARKTRRGSSARSNSIGGDRRKLNQQIIDISARTFGDITDGLENAAAAFIGMLEGRNFGKALVRVAPSVLPLARRFIWRRDSPR